MIRKPYDLLNPQGVLVIESATIRNPALRDHPCVEIIYAPFGKYKLKYHISMNVTHMPSARAVEAWLKMVGFQDVERSECHQRQSAALAKNRAAFICRKADSDGGIYYATVREENYVMGKAL